LIASAGFLVGKFFSIQPRLLSQVTLYLFTPCLTFELLTSNNLLGSEILGLFGFALSIAILVAGITFLIGRLMRLERKMMAAVLLSSIFMNAGNFGLPLLGFSFGEKAQAYGALYFVSMIVVTNTVGIAIASSGSVGLRQSLVNLIKFPTLYAVFLALLFLYLDWELPLPVARSVDILGGAAVPCMLVLLGMQIQVARWDGRYRALTLALSSRMLLAPVLALGLSQILGLQGVFYQAVVVESSMPPAVMNTLLATEFDTEPSFVTFTTLAGTLASPLTLTPLLAFLGA
jgi:malate permease and related proteins